MERNEQVLSFIAEWFDPHPQLVKQYSVRFYTETSEVDMKDLSTNRKFLKRTKLPSNINSKVDFVVGGQISLFSRDLKLVGYGDDTTKRLLEAASENTVILIPPKFISKIGKIVHDIETIGGGYTLINAKTFSSSTILGGGGGRNNDTNVDKALQILQAGGLSERELFDVGGDDGGGRCIGAVLSFRGRKSIEGVKRRSDSWKKNYGNGIWCAASEEDVERIGRLFYRSNPGGGSNKTTTTAVCQDGKSTCCVIKPHAIRSNNAGAVLDAIVSSEGFDISAMQMFHLDRVSASEFYEVYNGVMEEFNAMVDQLASGPCLALEISGTNDGDRNEHVVTRFRDCAGPWDVDIARELYPSSIRARFGESRVENAIHCTDLADDGVTEVAYFFQILQGSQYTV